MVAFARAGIASLVLAALVCVRAGGLVPGLAHLRREACRGAGGIVLLGTISFTGTSLIAMTAQQFLPASVNGLLNNLNPLWLALVVVAAGRARNAAVLLTGSTFATAGVALVLLGSAPDAGAPKAPLFPLASPLSSLFWLGVLISLGGSMLIAYSNVVARRVMAGRDPLALTAIAAGCGAIPLLVPLAFGVGGSLAAYATASTTTKALLLWLGTGSTAFNFSLWFYALAHLPVTRVANFAYLIPPLGVLLAVLFLGEPAGLPLLVGTFAIVAGIALAQRGAEAVGSRQ